MLKWLMNNAAIVVFGLLLAASTIIVSIMWPVWFYVMAGILVMYMLSVLVFFEGKAYVQNKYREMPTNQLNTREGYMRAEQYLKKHMTDDCSEKQSLEDNNAPVKNWYTHVSEGLNSFCGCFFAPPKPKTKTAMDEIIEAAERCGEQMDNQNREIKMITQALKNFNAEMCHWQKKLDAHFSVTGQSDQSRIGEFKKEQGVKSREALSCSQLLDELHELMATYPNVTFCENPSVDAIELYVDAERKHHEKVLALVDVLFPELSSLLNEGKELNRNVNAFSR